MLEAGSKVSKILKVSSNIGTRVSLKKGWNPSFLVGISVITENGIINIIAFVLIVGFIVSCIKVSINVWNTSKVVDILVGIENSIASIFKLISIVQFTVSGISLD